MDFFTVVIAAIVVGIVSLWLYLTRNRGYIETLDIPVDPPYLCFGSEPRVLHKTSYDHFVHKFKELGTKTYGRYDGVTPVIVTKDPELIKSVLVKNFDSFTSAFDAQVTDKATTLDMSDGVVWKSLRKNMSPTFTSGKLKGMLEPISGVVDKFLEHVEKNATKGDDVEVKPLFQGLALNVIAKCAFGINTDAISNPDTPIIKEGLDALSGFVPKTWFDTIVFSLLVSYFPGSTKYVDLLPKAWTNLWTITSDIMKQREDQNITSKDFIARLMELKKEVALNPHTEFHQGLNDDIITAQGIIFFVAGFETTANTMSTLCYSLAKWPEVQDRVYKEVNDVMDRHNGKINHETIEEMEYLEATINENLRLHSPVVVHLRVCNKDTEIAPGLVVKKGMKVEMPMNASQVDEEFFPNPTSFEPERFLKENAKNIVPYTYRPFGGGPRGCIATRFAINEVKITIAKLLSQYTIVETENTKMNIPKGSLFILDFVNLRVKFEKRDG